MPDEPPTASANREFASQMVAAYVRRNQIAADQMTALISTVYKALADLGKPTTEAEAPRTPAVPIRQSARRDYVVCQDCGWKGPDAPPACEDSAWVNRSGVPGALEVAG